MATSWLLPDNIADILPRQARLMEEMRRTSLDLFATHGFELVEPPMIEYADSLLTGSGRDLDNATFKFMDRGSGRMVGLRADFTPQAARIDAHILASRGVTRLCYAGPCLHARPAHPLASREPFVAGAELYGARGLAADLEVVRLAVTTLRRLGVKKVHIDLGHMGILRAILSDRKTEAESLHALLRALRMKDPVALEKATQTFTDEEKSALFTLIENFGGEEALHALEERLPADPAITEALAEVRALAAQCGADEVGFDFCDVHGYEYLTGMTFAVYLEALSQPVVRGGRYDGVGLAFGRSRPASGFTVYLRALSSVLLADEPARPDAIVASAGDDPVLVSEVEKLRKSGHIVVRLLPGETPEQVQERFRVTQLLVRAGEKCELKPYNGQAKK